ncbi:MAG: hypothetical protein A3F54_04230 [Candidatus Kerfeldbacteria bacterium RIFCSPHIGHO2_12_FULL_48_17]|uniref:ORC1/DEAH AAA+ ATPase domain-containing protein n=1 Tax=Candidatus Kerfeldbacteria bacterium RIFCSPHIGHO2_12_FULL_48_17 TaxID=1798542 RepID=A0A1G2B7F2_9BACT|nr:MAG: hypothetical protein A3F54_04230 [Candidatus Kerfeldbacteria bacterium RIFCSPHIGHO2_12_FULL_48_17]
MQLYDYQQKVFEKITKSNDTRQRFAIRGEHGSGKTTLLMALWQHYEQQRKKVIYINGLIVGSATDTGFLVIAEELGIQGISSKVSSSWLRYVIVQELRIQQYGDKLLFLLDEMYACSGEFQGYLRALCEQRNCSLIATRHFQDESAKSPGYISPLYASPLEGIIQALHLHKSK